MKNHTAKYDDSGTVESVTEDIGTSCLGLKTRTVEIEIPHDCEFTDRDTMYLTVSPDCAVVNDIGKLTGFYGGVILRVLNWRDTLKEVE